MFCKKCNGAIDSDAKFCSYCGCEVTNAPKTSPTRFWIKLVVNCALVVAALFFIIALVSTDPTDTIQNQIRALRADHYTEAYYNFTSKSFQDAVSLENFRSFFSKYPLFTTNDALKILEENIDSNVSTIDAVISSHTGEQLPVQYRLIKEGDRWKILSIKFKDINSATKGATAQIIHYNRDDIAEAGPSIKSDKAKKSAFDPKPLYDVVEKQIKAIKEGDIDSAYNNFASTDFRKATSLATFKKFVNNHPAFVDNTSIDFDKLSVENNVVTLSGMLVSKGDHFYPFNYSLISEGGVWHVLHIEVLAEKKSTKSVENTLFERFSLGTTVNGEGLITDPKVKFDPNAGEIHMNLVLKNAVEGTKIDVEFKHIESGSKAPIATAKVPESGDQTLSFAFTPPPKGWPKGNYRIDATSSTDAQGSVKFQVE